MAQVEIQNIFQNKRLCEASIIIMFIYCVYFPIGVSLVLLRSLISLQYLVLLYILPKDWLLRRILLNIYVTLFLGIVVTENKENKKDDAKVIVSNHISHLDELVIETVKQTFRLDTASIIGQFMGWSANSIQDSSLPVSFFPEKASTNGKAILKFSAKDIFERQKDKIIQPVILTAYRPSFMPIHIHTLHSTFWTDLLWCMLVPYTVFHIRYLPVVKFEEVTDENIEKLRQDMANALNIEAVPFRKEDKADYIKRLRKDQLEKERQRQQAQAQQIYVNPNHVSINGNKRSSIRQLNRNDKMIEQVKNVLPQVPIEVIKKDIANTNNVDRTITNLIDGSVNYKPLNEIEQKNEKIKLERMEKENKSFHVSSEDRHMSIQQRKKIMISEARRKYLEKHPEYI